MSHKISIRLEKELLEFIDSYAMMMGIVDSNGKANRSRVIKELLKSGTSNIATMELVKKFQDELRKRWVAQIEQHTKLINEGKNLVMVRDAFTCKKCHAHDNLDVYNIDRNPLNTNPTNLITLCKGCITKVLKYAPQRRVYEDFVEWFFLL